MQGPAGGRGVGRWLHERSAGHFARSLWLVSATAIVLLLQVPSASVGLTYFGFTAGDAAIWLGIATLGTFAAWAVVLVVTAPLVRPVARWRAGDRSEPEAALASLNRLPPVLGQRGTIAMLVLQLGVTYPVGVVVSDVGWKGVVGLGFGSVYLGFTSGVLVAWGAQYVVYQTAAELVEVVPSSSMVAFEVRGWTLRMRLVSISACVVALACVSVGAIVLRGDADEGHYLAFTIAAGLLATYSAWVIDAVVRPTLAPLFALREGTDRVGRGDLGTPVPVSSLDEIGGLTVAFNKMQQGLAERAALHAAFGSYVDPTLAQRVLDSGSAVFDGEDVVATILFADVRGFTALAEGISPGEAVALLNELFDVVVPVLQAHGGHANHYLGDGLLAVFGAPLPLDRHADAALAAAVEMQQVVRERFGHRLPLGIGINTGEVIAGSVGGGGRLEFTVIGDAVNVAARVEELTKDTGDAILITEATRAALSTPRRRSTRRGEFEIRGKAARVELHGVNPFPRTTR